jgi:hypothetical protein
MFGSKDGVNYYEVLEVPPDAVPAEIQRAYQRAKATYSQDNPALYSMFSREEARDLLKLVDEAYSVLGNNQLRRAYDESLQKNGAQPFAQRSTVSADHQALPDFVVPDPSIPGSIEMAAAQIHSPPPSTPVVIPTAPVSTPAPPPSEFGPRETVIVTTSEFTVRKREAPPTLKQGMAKCPMGTYPVDGAMEQEIAAKDEFDGPFLKKIRTYKQVPLEKLSESSRIGKTYLIALESNDFKNLPAPVFLRGFLVQIARQLGLDENKVVTSYMKLAKKS